MWMGGDEQSQGSSNQQRHEHGSDGQMERHGQALLDQSSDRALAHVARAEVSLSYMRQPHDVLGDQRLVESKAPVPHFYLAAALALLGSPDEARAAVQAGLVLNPTFTLRRYRARAVSDDIAYLARRERISEGMRMAGVPEG